MSNKSESMVSIFKDLQNDLNTKGKTAAWKVAKKSGVMLLSLHKMQNDYGKLMLKYPNSPTIPFFESSSLTESDIKNYKESVNINKQINKQLRDSKKSQALK